MYSIAVPPFMLFISITLLGSSGIPILEPGLTSQLYITTYLLLVKEGLRYSPRVLTP